MLTDDAGGVDELDRHYVFHPFTQLGRARHYLHPAQDTLEMMGISLSGTPTMKYNPRIGEAYAWARATGAV
jgi:hypothetical protein